MNIAVYCGSASGNRPSFTEGAKALGSWIAQNGHTLVYGGSRTGLMGATADAVLAGGGKVIGVIPDVKLIQERRHPGLTECIETKDMAERKQKMIELADAYVALPGRARERWMRSPRSSAWRGLESKTRRACCLIPTAIIRH